MGIAFLLSKYLFLKYAKNTNGFVKAPESLEAIHTEHIFAWNREGMQSLEMRFFKS